MSDLVKRLRETSDDWPACLVKLELEAADHIEQLEQQLKTARNDALEEAAKICEPMFIYGHSVAGPQFTKVIADKIRAAKDKP